jgi:hypothetical protein
MNPPGSDELVYQFYVFHGTDHQSTASIYCHGFRFPGNPREDHYLGQGIYFFREDWQQARVWAEIKIMRVDELEGSSPCIIKAYIRVPERKFLNLDTRWGMRELAQHLQTIQGELRKKEKTIRGSPQVLRCFIMDLLPRERFYVIQRTFSVPSKYDNINAFQQMGLSLHGVQICVGDLSVIEPDSISCYNL